MGEAVVGMRRKGGSGALFIGRLEAVGAVGRRQGRPRARVRWRGEVEAAKAVEGAGRCGGRGEVAE